MVLANWRLYTYAQVSLALISFSEGFLYIILTDYIEYLARMSMVQNNETIHDVFDKNASSLTIREIESQVQPKVSLINVVISAIEHILPPIFIIFMGSWSDVYGRKPILLLVMTCKLLNQVGLVLISLFYSNPWLVVVTYIPMVFVGELHTFLLTVYAYVTDITSDHDRTWHISCVLVIVACGALFGQIGGSIIFDNFGYVAVFISAATVNGIGILYTIYFVPESLRKKTGGEFTDAVANANKCSYWKILKNVFLVIKQTYHAVTTKHKDFDMVCAWLCIAASALLTMSMLAEISIMYLFVQARLGWNVDMYSNFLTMSILCMQIIGPILGMKIVHYCFGNLETIAALIFTVSSFTGAMILSFATKSWHVYLATAFGSLSHCDGAIINSVFSKVMPHADTGKLFAVLSAIESVLVFGGSLLYNLVYSHTMPPIYPSPVWLLSASLKVLILIILLGIHIRFSRRKEVEV